MLSSFSKHVSRLNEFYGDRIIEILDGKIDNDR